MIFCTQLTFDLFLRLRSNYRLGIHPYVFCHISRNNISMGRIMYSILPSKVKISVFFPMGLPTTDFSLTIYSNVLKLCIYLFYFIFSHLVSILNITCSIIYTLNFKFVFHISSVLRKIMYYYFFFFFFLFALYI